MEPSLKKNVKNSETKNKKKSYKNNFLIRKKSFSWQNRTKTCRNFSVKAFHVYSKFGSPRVIFKPRISFYIKTNRGLKVGCFLSGGFWSSTPKLHKVSNLHVLMKLALDYSNSVLFRSINQNHHLSSFIYAPRSLHHGTPTVVFLRHWQRCRFEKE